MLKYIKRHIYVFTFFITVLIYIIFALTDISKMQRYQKKKSISETENSIYIENVYIEISKKYQECVSSGTSAKEKQIESIANEKKESVINFYSSNPWRIKIPKLRIDAPIAEGTSQEALRRTVGHFEETDIWEGNVALAGHNRGYRCNFFQEIKKLEKGDIIIYTTEIGERKYQVVVNTIIKETDWNYIENTKDNRITLITCEANRRAYRRCIQAVEIKSKE